MKELINKLQRIQDDIEDQLSKIAPEPYLRAPEDDDKFRYLLEAACGLNTTIRALKVIS